MALDITNNQAVTDFVNKLYKENLGGAAAQEGHDYWGGQIKAGTLDPNDLAGHLQWSHEGQQYADRKAKDLAAGINTTERWAGGVIPNDPDQSIAQQMYDDKQASGKADYRPAWIGKYDVGGDRAPGGTDYTTGRNAITDLTNINTDIGLARDYYMANSGTDINQNTSTPINNDGGGGDDGSTTTPGGLTVADLDAWWAKQNQNKGSGMDDFMKFMMLMSVMGGGRGGYGGGSQYGYGGLNPGGVMAAYNPLDQLQGMGSWFKDNFGTGATTSTVNAT